jgi:hypothetical protein
MGGFHFAPPVNPMPPDLFGDTLVPWGDAAPTTNANEEEVDDHHQEEETTPPNTERVVSMDGLSRGLLIWVLVGGRWMEAKVCRINRKDGIISLGTTIDLFKNRKNRRGDQN